MASTSEPINPPLWWNKAIIYWYENQTAITCRSKHDLPKGPLDPREKQEIINSLHLDHLDQFLQMYGFMLKPFDPVKDVPDGNADQDPDMQSSHASDADEPDTPTLNVSSPTGKYLFPSPSQGTVVVSFFHVERGKGMYSMPGMPGMMSMHGSGEYGEADMTRQVVKLINGNMDKLRQQGDVPLIAAMPNWLSGGTNGTPTSPIGGCGGHGCPIVPPIPVEDSTSSPCQWSISLPELSGALQGLKGKDVTVFVLDTIPTIEQIKDAAKRFNHNNPLLEDIVAGIQSDSIVIKHQTLPERLEKYDLMQPVTGRDIYGRLIGFNMIDHGLFVAGIVHDLVPEAKIECIRVLNDYGVGNTTVLMDALQIIQERMRIGDLQGKPVVINLSLVMTPAQEELARIWFGDDCCCQAAELADMMREIELLRAGLHRIIQSMTSLGAVVAASAGNDSNVHKWNAPMLYEMPERWGPRYPAAFPEVISVGAVDKSGNAAPYSNYPSLPPNHNGVATYGGGVPTPVPIPTDGSSGFPTFLSSCMTRAIDIDATVGVYSSPVYPALAGEDCQQQYDAPQDSNAWAYWVGTSFATPIISSLAALILEQIKSSSLPAHLWPTEVQRAITTAAGQQEMLGKVLNLQPEFGVSMLHAVQECQAAGSGSSEPGDIGHAG